MSEQLYEFRLSDGELVVGWIDRHFTRKGNPDWPTMRLRDGRLVGTHVSRLTPVTEEEDAA